MWKPCLVCSVVNLEMISIYRHPGKVDSILKFLLGLQAKQDDYLCKACCDQVINAFDSKQKYNESKQHEPNVLSDAVSVEHDLVGQIEISSSESEEDTGAKSDDENVVQIEISSSEADEDMEPKNDDELLIEDYSEIFVVDDENTRKIFGKWLSDNNFQLKEELEEETSSTDGLEVQNDVRGTANENLSASQREVASSSNVSDGAYEPKRGIEEDFNVVSLRADSRQSDSENNTEGFRKYYKRERSVDIDDNKDEEEILGGRETEEADVVRKQQQEEVIQCGICNETCSSITSYEVHMTEEHPSRKKLLDSPMKEKPCHEFDLTFSSKYNLRKHDRRKYDPKMYGARKRDTRKQERSQYTAEKSYKCLYCSKTFPSNYHQQRHISTHLRKKPHECSDCGIYFATESSLESHKITHTAERSFQCIHCSMVFKCKVDLSSHLQTHIQAEKKKPCEYMCPECGKGLTTPSGLRKHIFLHTIFRDPKKYDLRKHDTRKHERTQHTAEKSYKCSYCSKTFPSNYHKKRHVSTHLKKKRYRCSDCGIYFATESSLDSHMITHTAERPLKCSHCSMAFGCKFELSTHLQTHIQEQKDKPCEHMCPECGKGFPIPSALRCHIRSHTKPYICCECGKGYCNLRNLNIHQMEHTGQRPYECPHCPKAYRTNYNLLRHIRVHTKKVIRICSVCSKSFDDPRWLLAHQLHNHTEKRPYECPYCPKLFRSQTGLYDHLGKHMEELGDEFLPETHRVAGQS